MRKLYFRLTFTLLMFVVILGLQAQNKLYIQAKDRTKTSFPLNDIRKLTFPSRTISLVQNDGSTQAFPFSELRQARFTEFVSGNRSLNLTEDNPFSLFPNPINSELTLEIGSASGAIVEIRIVDVQGKTIIIRKEQLMPGINQINMQLSDIPKGLYVCRVNNDKSIKTKKFLKN